MKRSIIIVSFLAIGFTPNAQKAIASLVKAEKDFAAYSVVNSTKEAFLQYMDSAGIMFSEGKAVNGFEFWGKREKRTTVLNWWPVYADISSSGDLGFTTGPWTYQKTAADTVIARGQYSTVWHLNKNGEWKFLVDLGVENTPVNTDTLYWERLERTNPAVYKGSIRSMLDAEKKFIKGTERSVTKKDSRIECYRRNFSGSSFSLLNRNGRLPATETDPWLGAINGMPGEIKYTIIGSGIASSNDLGYVYGTTLINGKTENYLRVWRKELSGWKIAMEVLRY